MCYKVDQIHKVGSLKGGYIFLCNFMVHLICHGSFQEGENIDIDRQSGLGEKEIHTFRQTNNSVY